MNLDYPIWHPFSVEFESMQKIKIVKAKNEFLYDEKGNKYIDLISSWWTNIHGHRNLKIAKEIFKQAKKLEHVIFADFTHEPAINLCNKLKLLTQNNFQKFFFSDNGSTAVEVAIKIAYQFWKNKNSHNRNIFISFNGNYHGDTFGAMSIGKNSGFFDKFKELLFDVKFFDYPVTNDIEETGFNEDLILKDLENFIKDNSDKIAGIILEPLVQGSSGMRFSSKNFCNKILEISKKYNIISIFDEVMTGFGRTGKMFAYQHLNYSPDIICLSKGITAGFLPLGLTGVSSFIYKEFYSNDRNKVFLHGHSYTANPISCAASNASLQIFELNDVFSSISNIEKTYKKYQIKFEKLKIVQNFRILGDICAFEVDLDGQILNELKSKFMANFLVIRPLGKTIYIIPPYSIKLSNLKKSLDKIYNIVSCL